LERIGFGARLWLALVLPFRVLLDGELAARIREAYPDPALPTPRDVASPAESGPAALGQAPETVPTPVSEAEASGAPALQILSILQREGRLLDFLTDDVAPYSDAEVGAAARVVHEGCKRGLAQYVDLAPVRMEAEGAAVVLEPGFDAARTRVTGNVVGDPPYRGTLAHHGWRVTKLRLPKLAAGHDPTIIAPAEVELS
jgi:hypothetical protein